MVIALTIIFVILLIAQAFALGYFIGKGKIEVHKKLTTDEKKMLEEMEHTQKEALEKYNKAVESIVNYTDLGGEE